ncbi:hypothetical protein VSWAT3_16850 [Vibrionales bacterium SWAT-3]|nr:hypothetical protein VSWAT3_16850 [Vibrionales bacterium SWAT-3]
MLLVELSSMLVVFDDAFIAVYAHFLNVTK